MRSPENVLKSLSEKAKNKEYRYERLYRNLYNPEFYLLAYTAVFSSGDSASAGEDADDAIDIPQSAPFSFDWKWLLIPLGVGALGCAGYFGQKGYKHYINKKRGYE